MNESANYPRFYRKDGRCINRKSDTTGIEVHTPDPERYKDSLPLILTEVTYPDKERFDEEVRMMEECTITLYEDYIYEFIGRVNRDISKPMTERAIKKQLAQNAGRGVITNP